MITLLSAFVWAPTWRIATVVKSRGWKPRILGQRSTKQIMSCTLPAKGGRRVWCEEGFLWSQVRWRRWCLAKHRQGHKLVLALLHYLGGIYRGRRFTLSVRCLSLQHFAFSNSTPSYLLILPDFNRCDPVWRGSIGVCSLVVVVVVLDAGRSSQFTTVVGRCFRETYHL